MRNIGGRGGGMITAALFLSKFAGDGPWVHIDIASTDWSERERAYIPKGPTGIGTRLLFNISSIGACDVARLELTRARKSGSSSWSASLAPLSPGLAAFIKEYKPGGVILFSRNLESVEQIVELTNDLQQCSPQSPLLISIDQEGGRVSRLPKGFTIFPPCELIGQCNSYELAYAAAATIANEFRAVGINMNMAPVLDVNSNPDNPVIGDRAFGSLRDIRLRNGTVTAAGLQDSRSWPAANIFPGHGDTTRIRTKNCPWLSAARAAGGH